MSFFLGIVATGNQAISTELLHTLRQRKSGFVHEEPGGFYRANDAGQSHLVEQDIVVFVDGPVYDEESPPALAVAKAWRHWGPAFVKHLKGDFASLIWDRRSRTLHVFRDPLGTRRLYWSFNRGLFSVASEFNELVHLPGERRELAREHLSEYLSFRVVHAPRTLIRGIYQLEASHWLRLRDGQIHQERYWQPLYAPPQRQRPAEGTVLDMLEERLKSSIQLRYNKNEATGLYFSGGLGSTAIAAAARDLHLMLPSFTIGFDDDPHPESPFAGRVARLLNIENHGFTVGTPQVAGAVDPAIHALGAPNGNPAVILQYLLAQQSSQHASVILSGDGSVELFGGRMLDNLGGALRVAKAVEKLPRRGRAAVRSLIGRAKRTRPLVTPPQQYGLALALGGANLFSTDERHRLLRHPYLVRPEVRQQVLEPYYADLTTDPVNSVLNAYLNSQLIEDALLRAERTAQAFKLSLRFPLLDRDLLQAVCELPGSFKLRRVSGSVHSRWPLRALLSGVLPPTLVHRPKRGMPTPGSNWFKGSGRLFFEERFQKLSSDPYRLWRIDGLNHLKRETLHGNQGAARRLWALFLLDGWLDTLDSPR